MIGGKTLLLVLEKPGIEYQKVCKFIQFASLQDNSFNRESVIKLNLKLRVIKCCGL